MTRQGYVAMWRRHPDTTCAMPKSCLQFHFLLERLYYNKKGQWPEPCPYLHYPDNKKGTT